MTVRELQKAINKVANGKENYITINANVYSPSGHKMNNNMSIWKGDCVSFSGYLTSVFRGCKNAGFDINSIEVDELVENCPKFLKMYTYPTVFMPTKNAVESVVKYLRSKETEAEERKKYTSEINGSERSGDASHGGDSNSGETDSTAEKSSTKTRTNQNNSETNEKQRPSVEKDKSAESCSKEGGNSSQNSTQESSEKSVTETRESQARQDALATSRGEGSGAKSEGAKCSDKSADKEVAKELKQIAKSKDGNVAELQSRQESQTSLSKDSKNQNAESSELSGDSLVNSDREPIKRSDLPNCEEKRESSSVKKGKKTFKVNSKKATAFLKKTRHNTFGGINASAKQSVNPDQVNKVRAILSRLINGNLTTHKVNWSKTITNIKCKFSDTLSRIEDSRPTILICPDLSGSMASLAEPAMKVSKTVAQIGVSGADVLLVSHSNGAILNEKENAEYCLLNKKHLLDVYPDLKKDSYTKGWEMLIKKHNIQVVIWIGDEDGQEIQDEIKSLPSVTKFFKIDNSSCNTMGLTIAENKGKYKYVYGCKDVEDIIKALNLI